MSFALAEVLPEGRGKIARGIIAIGVLGLGVIAVGNDRNTAAGGSRVVF